MTKKEKLERFDQQAAQLSKLDLALYDLANDKFGPAIKVFARDLRAGETGFYVCRLSLRHDPLVLIHDHTTGERTVPSVWTETEIRAQYRDNPTSYWARLCRVALDRLTDANNKRHDAAMTEWAHSLTA